MIDEHADGAMLVTGYDDCIIGIGHRIGLPPLVVYDRSKIISKLTEDGLTPEEAEEYFEFNILGAYVGEATPIFTDIFRRNKLPELKRRDHAANKSAR